MGIIVKWPRSTSTLPRHVASVIAGSSFRLSGWFSFSGSQAQ